MNGEDWSGSTQRMAWGLSKNVNKINIHGARLSGERKRKMDRIKFKLNGLVPQMQHSNKMADPLNIYKKAVAQYISKRKKTDADELMIARIEWRPGFT